MLRWRWRFNSYFVIALRYICDKWQSLLTWKVVFLNCNKNENEVSRDGIVIIISLSSSGFCNKGVDDPRYMSSFIAL